jgi:putative endonuclease
VSLAGSRLCCVDAPHSRLDLGRTGEAVALAHYLGCGYRVLARNWRCSLGEIDLVVCKGSLLVFCEVKSRRGLELGAPYEAVNWKKQRKLRILADAFLAASGRRARAVRFDVASVTLDTRGNASLFMFEDAF